MATDFEITVLQKLGEIQATSAATAQKVTSLEERLFNDESGVVHELKTDIQEIKTARESEARWDRVHNVAHYSMGPILIILHQIARKFGISM